MNDVPDDAATILCGSYKECGTKKISHPGQSICKKEKKKIHVFSIYSSKHLTLLSS